MDTQIYGAGTKTIQLRVKGQFQQNTGYFKNTKTNYSKKAIKCLKMLK